MAHTITKETELDKEYYGCETRYVVDFAFKKQKAKVTIDVHEHGVLHLTSNTDGYHWLQFLLCQDPETSKMLDIDFKSEVSRCQTAFSPLNIKYEQEGKDTAWLTCSDSRNEADTIKEIVEVIEARFANRERFFKDAKNA